MATRRDLLQIGAAITVTAAAQEHHGTPEPAAAAPRKARFFKPAEMELLAKLVDQIIPRTDTPGAADANVHFYIDWQAYTSPVRGAQIRRDLAWVRKQKLLQSDAAALLTAWSKSTGEPRRIFQSFKDLTVDGYYGTREGLEQELGWHGNTFVRQFPGCTHKEHA